MTWIKTIHPKDASPELLEAISSQRGMYPPEYSFVDSAEPREKDDPSLGICFSHSLIPDALKHAFSLLGSLLQPELPLTRRQHEMIAATVSSLNRCHY